VFFVDELESRRYQLGMDINSQIQAIIQNHSSQVAFEVGQLFGQAFKASANGTSHANGATNGTTNGTASVMAATSSVETPKAKKAAKKTKAKRTAQASPKGPKATAADKAKAKAAKAPKTPKAAKAPKKSGPGEKRDPKVLEALTESLYSYIKANPGQRIEAIATGMKTTTRELNLPMKKLAKAGRVASKGEKRATSYHAKG